MIRLFLLLTTFIFSSQLLSANEVEVTDCELPEVSKILLASHFKDSRIVKIICNPKKHTYKVDLDKGKSIVFNETGEWIGINCKGEPIPFLLIPSHIRNKIAHLYGMQACPIEIRKVKKKIHVMLNNGIELSFNMIQAE